MFYSQQYNQYIVEGTPFVLGDIQYPANWLNLSSPEEKAEAGLVEVVATNSPADHAYYWVSEELNGAELTYINTPKDLDSLKVQCTEQINQTAYSLLFPTDWMVVKAIETQTKIIDSWNTYRANVRSSASAAKDKIQMAFDIDSLITACDITWPVAPDQEA